MNTKTLASLLFASSLFLTSCKKELQPQESSVDTTAVANAAPGPNAVAPTQVAPVQPNQPVQTVTAPAPPAPPQPVTVAKGMNPPHGQPNHRCDIAVGAPLNSPPGKAPAAPQMTVAPQASGAATIQKGLPGSVPAGIAAPGASAPVVTAPGMNPPHGQAGHDCAIAVGAPLPKK